MSTMSGSMALMMLIAFSLPFSISLAPWSIFQAITLKILGD